MQTDAARPRIAPQTHAWRCGDLSHIVAGPQAGRIGWVEFIYIGASRKTVLGIRPQGSEVIEADASDCIPK